MSSTLLALDTSSADSAPPFTLEVLERDLGAGKGSVTCITAASNCVIVGTSRGVLLSYDFSAGTSSEMDLASATRGGMPMGVETVSCDPTGQFVAATLCSGSSSASAGSHGSGGAFMPSVLASALAGYHYGQNASPGGMGQIPQVFPSHMTGSSPSSGTVTPTLNRFISSATGALARDTVVTHWAWKKVRSVSRLRGVHVLSAAWNRHPTEPGVKEVLLGTAEGQVFEVAISDRDKRDKYAKLVLELPRESAEPITCLHLESLFSPASSSHRFYAVAVTPTRLYLFVGAGSLESVFQGYSGGDKAFEGLRFVELPGFMPHSQLHFFARRQRRGDVFAWMAGPGIYHGRLNLQSPGGEDTASATGGGGSFVSDGQLLEYIPLSSPAATNSSGMTRGHGGGGGYGGGDSDLDHTPISMTVTAYHFVVLYRHGLQVINSITGKVVFEERFPSQPSVSGTSTPYSSSLGNSSRSGDLHGHHGHHHHHGPSGMRAVVRDPSSGVVYVCGQQSLYELVVRDEERDVWKDYLDKGEYALALEHCRTLAQKDRVHFVRAEEAFRQGDYCTAAALYAKTTTTSTFEEMALKFVAVSDRDALLSFLLHKLDHLGRGDRTQVTMVATWATELYLDKLNYLAALAPLGMDASSLPTRRQGLATTHTACLEEFLAFLSDYKDALHEPTTVRLLGSYGQRAALLHFAKLKDDYKTLIGHHIEMGDAASALGLMRHPKVPLEHLYANAPALMAMAPRETIDTCVGLYNSGASHPSGSLQHRRLLPAFVRYGSEGGAADASSKGAEGPRSQKILGHQSSAYGTGNDGSSSGMGVGAPYSNEAANTRFLPGGAASSLPGSDGPGGGAAEAQGGGARVVKAEDVATCRNEAIRFLETVIRKPGHSRADDPAIYNVLLSLYAKQDDERRLLNFLSSATSYSDSDDASGASYSGTGAGGGGGGHPRVLYDPKLALRLCLKEGRMAACVAIYSALGMHEEAVSLALQFDLELAKAEAGKPVGDDELRKRLWLRVAREVIERGPSAGDGPQKMSCAGDATSSKDKSEGATKGDSGTSPTQRDKGQGGAGAAPGGKRDNSHIRRAIQFLGETDGLLRIEDVLPFFPEFVLIDDFKDAICASLEDYNNAIASLRSEMDESTRRAAGIRNDIAALAQRCTVVQRDEPCAACRATLAPAAPKFALGAPPGAGGHRGLVPGGGVSFPAPGGNIRGGDAAEGFAGRVSGSGAGLVPAPMASLLTPVISSAASAAYSSAYSLASAAVAGVGSTVTTMLREGAGGAGTGASVMEGSQRGMAQAGRGGSKDDTAAGLPVTASYTPFYVFPCGHSFHADCLVMEVVQAVGPALRQRVLELKWRALEEAERQALLPAAGSSHAGGHDGAAGGASLAAELQARLDEAIASECPFCGELAIRVITQPFIGADEALMANSWSL
eukprot:jgi/Mesvir1/27842/Mv07518-RA.1